MKVYMERLRHTTDINETEMLDVIKSISVSVGIGGDYALILGEFPVYQSNVKKIRKNRVKYGFLTLFRIPSAIEVYICRIQYDTFSVLYNSRGSSYWRMFGVYFTGVPFWFDKYTFIGEV